LAAGQIQAWLTNTMEETINSISIVEAPIPYQDPIVNLYGTVISSMLGLNFNQAKT
jgi:hypothetical protein